MSLYRLIFRLDFDPVFQVIDSAGKILRIFQDFKSNDEHVWPTLGENHEKRSVTAQAQSEDEGWYRSITIDPTCIVGELETVQGIPLGAIEKNDHFIHLEHTANALRKEFQLTNFQRLGIRFYVFTQEIQKDRANEFVSRFIADDIKKPLKEILGQLEDTGIALDGVGEDKISYHFNFGPHKREFIKLLNKVPKNRSTGDAAEGVIENTGLLFDIDLFERAHHLAETTRFIKWCMPLFEKAEKSVNIIKSLR